VLGPLCWDYERRPGRPYATEAQAPVGPLFALDREALAEEGVEGVGDQDYLRARSRPVRTKLGSVPWPLSSLPMSATRRAPGSWPGA